MPRPLCPRLWRGRGQSEPRKRSSSLGLSSPQLPPCFCFIEGWQIACGRGAALLIAPHHNAFIVRFPRENTRLDRRAVSTPYLATMASRLPTNTASRDGTLMCFWRRSGDEAALHHVRTIRWRGQCRRDNALVQLLVVASLMPFDRHASNSDIASSSNACVIIRRAPRERPP
jgi:hypothetical protein